MRKSLLGTGALAMLASLSACGDSGDPAATPSATASAQETMAMNNPFAEAETQMNQKMMAAIGTDAGDNWAKKMVEHHQGAIDMARIMLERNPTPDVEKMARDSIGKQQKDIENIRKLFKTGAPDQKSAELYRPAMTDMKKKMMAATGADASETFMRKMLEHHLGAVAMSDVALKNGVTGALREQIQKTRDENAKDAKMTEAMLGGKSFEEAMTASGSKSAVEAKAEPAQADKARTGSQGRATPVAKAKETPKATSAPNSAAEQPPASKASCSPEHRAAGHC